MNQKGFTYLEVVISFTIFGLMLLIVINLSNTVSTLMRYNMNTNQMQQIAELELENYRTAIIDVNDFTLQTGFSLVTENLDSDGNLINRRLQNNNVGDKYIVTIDEMVLNENMSEIKVQVQRINDDINPVIIYLRAFRG